MEPLEQVGPVNPFGVFTSSPLGKESLNPTLVNALEFGLVKVNVNVDVLPFTMLVGEKLFVSVG